MMTMSCLLAYNEKDSFADFVDNDDLRHSEKYFKVITDFRDYYSLRSFTFKQLDKCLWRLGERIKDDRFN